VTPARIHVTLHDEDPSYHGRTLAYFELNGADVPDDETSADYLSRLRMTVRVELPDADPPDPAATWSLGADPEPAPEPEPEPEPEEPVEEPEPVPVEPL
jgi:outer membrane biosynthesis protein TonB